MATPPITKPDTKNSMLWRIYVIMLVMMLGALIIILRIGTMQYFEGEALLHRADSLQIKLRDVEAPRGNILAADGSLLAATLPYYDVFWDLKKIDSQTFFQNLDTLSVCLATFVDGEYTIGGYAEFLRQERERLMLAYDNEERFFSVRRNLSYLELERLKTFPIFNGWEDRNKSGVIIKTISKRQYPFKILANRTVGYVRTVDSTDNTGQKVVLRDSKGEDSVPQVIRMKGLELSYDKILAGESGKRQMRKAGHNIWIPIDDITQIEPRAGKDILTTIDINLQEVTENALMKAMNTYQGDHGCAIVMDVKTGDIKAIANLGQNIAKDGSIYYWEDYNYAIQDKAMPGSTFKIATMMALFADGYLNLKDTIDLQYGKAKFYDEWMEDASAHGLGLTSVEKAFEVSSNVGIAKLANRYYNRDKESQKKYVQHLKDFMLNRPTNIELDGEQPPYIKDPEQTNDWSGITIPWMSIGYELELTPLQTLAFYNAIANNGVMMKPRLVQAIQSYGQVEQVFKPEIVSREIASKDVISFAQQLLLRPVEGSAGTAKAIRSDQYKIAGKTGTAIMNYKDYITRGVPKKYLASFAGFFPADNPKYTCVVVIHNPKSGFYGGTVAAPVFKEIADKCYAKIFEAHAPINTEPVAYKGDKFPDLQVGYKEDLKKVMDYLKIPFIEEANTAWAVGRVQGDSLYLLMRNMQEDVVPNVVGMGLRDALFLLENRKIQVQIVGAGKVKSQSVKPGRSIQSVNVITLILG